MSVNNVNTINISPIKIPDYKKEMPSNSPQEIYDLGGSYAKITGGDWFAHANIGSMLAACLQLIALTYNNTVHIQDELDRIKGQPSQIDYFI